MNIYQFTLNNPKSDLLKSSDWINSCYRYFIKSGIDEVLITRHTNLIDIFVLGTNAKNINKVFKEYSGKNVDHKLQISENVRINHEALTYFFEIFIGQFEGLPADPQILLKMRDEFNLALNEGAVGSILTRMYTQGENIGNTLQNDPVIQKNCITRSDVILDIVKKIAGNIKDFQFIFIGSGKHLMKDIVNSVKNLNNQKVYIYHDDFSRAYQSGIYLGCIPLDKKQLEHQLNENTVFLDFEVSNLKKINWSVTAAKQNRNLIYIYFDLLNNERKNYTSFPPNLYLQTNEQITGLINNHIENRREYLQTMEPLLENEIKTFYSWLYSDDRYVFNNIVSADRRMQKVFELIRRIAPSDINVLVSGETGTGKELIARAIHQNSPRRNARFVAVNCSAIPDTLLEGELFGYEKGSFTGAISAKKGLIEIASGGTLFLDEIGDLPPMIQVKLLRVLQEREILQIGTTNPTKVDIRLVTASNQNLDKLAEKGDFRSDFYYRINTVQIKLPALRERRSDIPILTDYFIKRLNRNMGKQINKISDDVIKRFISYDWPGNIRELENIIERAFAVSIGEEITVIDLPTRLQSITTKHYHQKDDDSAISEKSLKQMEAERIRDLIIKRKISLSETAHILGIGRTTLWRKMREFGISKDKDA
jgi:transcriptional regulator with PAS, ATPase and Fis domain